MDHPTPECILTAADPLAGLVRAAVPTAPPAGLVFSSPLHPGLGGARREHGFVEQGGGSRGFAWIRLGFRLQTAAFLLAAGWHGAGWIQLGFPPATRPPLLLGPDLPSASEFLQLPSSLLDLTGGLMGLSLGAMLLGLSFRAPTHAAFPPKGRLA